MYYFYFRLLEIRGREPAVARAVRPRFGGVSPLGSDSKWFRQKQQLLLEEGQGHEFRRNRIELQEQRIHLGIRLFQVFLP